MKKKILVADDDRVMLKYITDLLTREGHEVVAAEDGYAVLNLLADFTPDIMFLDLIMPKIDGTRLIQIVRNMPHLKDCHVAIVSAAVAEIDFSFNETDADSYIAKGPFATMAQHFKSAIETLDAPQPETESKPIRGLESIYARQLTKELLSRNRHLETILESMAEGILEVYSNKVVYANGVAVSLLGLSLEKILAAYPPNLFGGSLQSRLDDILQNNAGKAIEIGQKTPIEFNGRRLVLKILPVKNEPATVIIMITDVTEHKRMEMQLQHKQKMEAIGTIAAGVAHNFRNTLTEVMVNSQLIEMNFEDQGGLHEVAGRINTSVKRGARLVDSLLQFSRKQIKEEFNLINLTQVIHEIFLIIQKSFDQKIEIQTDLAEELPIMGDITSLSQAFMNLSNNARDAMLDGGRLTIRARREGRKALVSVSDTGEGMDKEAAKKCFDPFYTTKPPGKGTGLGLSTTYGIIKNHDGLITVDSRPGRGTTFQIHFPLVEGDEQCQAQYGLNVVCGNGELVLVVDDEPEIQNAMRGMLKNLGYRAEFASNGAEGLEKYRSTKPDAVLMDLNMPGMDGVAGIEEIFNFDPEAKISVFSGYNQEAIENLSSKARAAIKDFILKPIDIQGLSLMLAKMLKGG